MDIYNPGINNTKSGLENDQIEKRIYETADILFQS